MRKSLDQLALHHGTDKSSAHHNYCVIYERYLEHLRDEQIKLLEIGYGGYKYPNRGGESLRMWLDYFPNAQIVCLELYEKIGIKNPRFHPYKGSQDDRSVASKIVFEQLGQFNVIIDDASHVNITSILTFDIWFPYLKSGGIYIIEDIESSWCPVDGWAQGCADQHDYDSISIINHFRMLTTHINRQYVPNYFLGVPIYDEIESIHFYKNLIIVLKR